MMKMAHTFKGPAGYVAFNANFIYSTSLKEFTSASRSHLKSVLIYTQWGMN